MPRRAQRTALDLATLLAFVAAPLAMGFTAPATGVATSTVATVPVSETDTRAASTVSLTVADITWGETATVSVTVDPSSATGTVELSGNAKKLGEGTLSAGKTTIQVAAKALPAGDHQLTLIYPGDDHHWDSWQTVDLRVREVTTAVSGTAADITWGDSGSVAVTVTPASATGTVKLSAGESVLDEATLTSGGATFMIPAGRLLVGEHDLDLTYVGDDNHASDEGIVTVNVVKASSSVSGTAADITWGQPGSLSVSVTPAAGGAVELFDGATKLGEGPVSNGSSSIDIKAHALAVGTHSLTLKYEGDSSHSDSQGTTSVTVVKASSSVSGTAADVTWGNAGSVGVTVAPTVPTGRVDLSGTVELYDGATKLGEGVVSNGTATVALAARAPNVGDHSLTLKYLGDGSHTASQSTVAVKVLKAPTTVSAPAVTLQWAKASSVAVTVSPAAGGIVELYDGATRLGTANLLGGGTARITLPVRSLEVGTHSLTVTYLGSGSYLPSQSTVTVTVTKGRSTVDVAVPTSVDAGDRAKIRATVDSLAGDVTGKVEILVKEVGGTFKKELSRNLDDGKAVARVKLPRAGKYIVRVKYLGDEHTLGDHVSTRVRVG